MPARRLFSAFPLVFEMPGFRDVAMHHDPAAAIARMSGYLHDAAVCETIFVLAHTVGLGEFSQVSHGGYEEARSVEMVADHIGGNARPDVETLQAVHGNEALVADDQTVVSIIHGQAVSDILDRVLEQIVLSRQLDFPAFQLLMALLELFDHERDRPLRAFTIAVVLNIGVADERVQQVHVDAAVRSRRLQQLFVEKPMRHRPCPYAALEMTVKLIV